MKMHRIVGLNLIIVGLIIFIFALNASDSLGDRLSNFFTGHFTESTVWYMVLGVVSMIGGSALMLVRGGKVAT